MSSTNTTRKSGEPSRHGHRLATPCAIAILLFFTHTARAAEKPAVPDAGESPRLAIRTAALDKPASLQLPSGGLRIDGATSLYGCSLSLARAVFGEDEAVFVKRSRTPHAYQALLDGECDLIFAFRPSERQAAQARAQGKEFTVTPIGYDAFVFLVNPANPVDGLSIRQIKDIYAGRLSNWRDLGGDNGPVRAYQRNPESGNQSCMERFMTGEALMKPPMDFRFERMEPIITGVAEYTNSETALGYSFLHYVEVMMAGGGVKVLEVDGVKPELATIRSGEYPLNEDVCIVTVGDDNPNTRPFIDWVLSAEGQALVEAAGFVPVSERPLAPKAAQNPAPERTKCQK